MAIAREYDVVIIGGFGHVGLPLGIALANTGCQVALYDIDETRGKAIRAGTMPFLEYDAEPILQQVSGRSLHVVDNLAAVAASDSIVVTIGTPLDDYLNPQLLPMIKLAEELLPYLRDDHHVILRSTVCPGTSQRLHDFFRDHGQQIHLAFCPERIAQGYAIRELTKLPQVISGFTEVAVERAEALFKRLGAETVVVSVTEAELAKLFSNAWRYI